MDDDVTKRPPALRPPPRLEEAKHDPKIALALALGEDRGRVAALEQQLLELRRQFDEVRFAQTRPRHDTLTEIEGAPHVAKSIRALEQNAPKARTENRWLTIGLAVVVVIAQVILHSISH